MFLQSSILFLNFYTKLAALISMSSDHLLTFSLVWQARRSASCLSKSVSRFSKALSVWETAASKCELEHLCRESEWSRWMWSWLVAIWDGLICQSTFSSPGNDMFDMAHHPLIPVVVGELQRPFGQHGNQGLQAFAIRYRVQQSAQQFMGSQEQAAG